MEPNVKEFVLSPAVCDDIAEIILEFCNQRKIDRKEALRYRVSAEECLLYWLDQGGAGWPVVLKMGQRLLAPYISLEVKGQPGNPYLDATEEFGTYCGNLLTNLRLEPEYSYENGWNRIYFRMKRKSPGQMATLGLVIAFAAMVGGLGALFLPEALRVTLLESLIIPVYNTFFHILSCIAGPMIFLSVAWGIYGIGDVATFGRVGKRMMLTYIGIVFLTGICCVAVFPILGPGLSFGAGQGGQFATISELILGIFPSSIVEPFATGNSLQIIFLAIVIGIALLHLGRQTSSVARAIEQVNVLVQFLMEIISRLVPFVIFLVIVNLIWSGDLAVLASVWKQVLVLAIALVLAAAVFLLYTGRMRKASPWVLLRKNMPTFLVALATASSAASFSSNVSTCEKKFGIDPALIRFGIPLGMVMHKPSCVIGFMVTVFYFAGQNGVSCSPAWIAIAVFICGIIAIATPPIPGGGAVAYSILFLQLGIPSDAVAVALAIDLITDFLLTAFEMFLLPLTLINVSARLAMIDEEVLRAP